MKNIIAGVLVAMVSTAALADTSLNPDKYPSVGLDFTQSQVGFTGPRSELYDPSDNTVNYFQGSTTLKANALVLDVRAPMNNYITLSLHGGPNTLQSFGGTQNGYSIGGGLRVYLPNLGN